MSYTKTQSISFPAKAWWREGLTDLSGGGLPAWTTLSGIVSAVRTRTGDRNPHYREQIRNGIDATTNLTGRYEALDYHGVSLSNRFKEVWVNPSFPNNLYIREAWGDTYWKNTDHTLPIKSASTSTTFVDNLARAAFLKKVKSETLKFHGEIFLGELKETLHMLHRPAFGLQKLIKEYYNSLKKRKRVAPKSWLNSVNELWLEQSFGWNPLIGDIKDAVTAYTKKAETERQHKISAGARKEYDTTNAQLSGTQYAPGKGFNAGSLLLRTKSARVIERITVRYRGAVRAKVEAPTWRDKSLLWGFSPQEFVPTAWELLPWSFLIDYFTNIGDILDGVTTSTNDLVYANRSAISECFAQYLFTARLGEASPGAGWSFSYGHDPSLGNVTTYRKDITRAVGVDVPTPSFQLNFNLTQGQLLNCAALLAQVSGVLHPQSQPRRWNGHL